MSVVALPDSGLLRRLIPRSSDRRNILSQLSPGNLKLVLENVSFYNCTSQLLHLHTFTAVFSNTFSLKMAHKVFDYFLKLFFQQKTQFTIELEN